MRLILIALFLAILLLTPAETRRRHGRRPQKPVRGITPAGITAWNLMRDHVLRGDEDGIGGHHTYNAIHRKWPNSVQTTHTHSRQDVYSMNVIDGAGTVLGRKTVFGASWTDAQVAQACQMALSQAGNPNWVIPRGKPAVCIRTQAANPPGTCYPDVTPGACGGRPNRRG
ncbi:hypothetical protein HDU97_009346 [Phlyctochytrium planicorne]|nr:hypothetical protein HDU97_009346 [Phlyctochytrium planicorne]